MILTVDIGNTNITLGGFDGDILSFIARLATERGRTSDQYAIDIIDILNLYGFSGEDFDGSIISSVVPILTEPFRKAIEMTTNSNPLILGPGVKTGLDIKIDNPAQLGADLVAGAVAITHSYSLPAIVYDLGTATTISVINELGIFLGVVISAGLGISLDAMTSRTASLPVVSLEVPNSVIGKNSADSMKSGLILGTASMIDGLTDRILEELHTKEATLVATGGLAPLVIKNCKYNISYSDTLILEGLKIIYYKNI